MNVVVLTTTWRRPKLTQFVLEHFKRLKLELAKEGINLYLFAAGSEGEASARMATEAGWTYTEQPNQPLYAKWLGLMELIRDRRRFVNADLYLVVGSDNLVNKSFIRIACAYVASGQHYGQPNGCVFVNIPDGRASFLQGFQGGAGRIFSAELAEKRMDFQLWRENPAYSVDHWQYQHVQTFLKRTELEGRMITFPIQLASPAQLVDIKGGGYLDGEETGVNIWPYEDFSPEKNPLCSHVRAKLYLGDYFPQVLDLIPTDEPTPNQPEGSR